MHSRRKPGRAAGNARGRTDDDSTPAKAVQRALREGRAGGGAEVDPDLPRHPATTQRRAGGRDRGRGARAPAPSRQPSRYSTAGSRSASTGLRLEHLAATTEAAKCSTRDLPRVLAAREPGATTVAATIFLARRVGIGVMATGGLGGVHQDGESSMDISADLEELARTRVVVVCSGIKSILDAPRTLERLETLGVPIVGYRCAELPSFYSAESGLPVPMVEGLDDLCRLIEAHDALGLPGGIVVVQPPPPQHAMPKELVDRLVADARAAARRAGRSRRGRDPVHAPPHGRAQRRRHGRGQLCAGAGQRRPRRQAGSLARKASGARRSFPKRLDVLGDRDESNKLAS